MKEFFGFGGYQRPAEGFLSWQHIVFVTFFVAVTTGLAIYLGRKNRNKSFADKNKVLIWNAIIIDACEIFRIIIACIKSGSIERVAYELPLFLCSIQLIAIPVAAFSKGKLKEATLDFVFIFGMLGSVLGTYGASQNYGCYPVLSFDNLMSALTHTLAGFACIYIGVSGMRSMKKNNIPFTFAILFAFCIMASITNAIVDYNYMFLVRDDGTPYQILFQLVNGHPVLYPMLVIVLFLIYIVAFYAVYTLIEKKLLNKKSNAPEESAEKSEKVEKDQEMVEV